MYKMVMKEDKERLSPQKDGGGVLLGGSEFIPCLPNSVWGSLLTCEVECCLQKREREKGGLSDGGSWFWEMI